MKKQLLLLINLLFISFYLSAQLLFTNYSGQNNINCLAESGSRIWIGSTGGLSVRDKCNGLLIATYTTDNGLICNNITDMFFDAMNNLWLASTMGIQKYNGTTWLSYTKDNTSGGLPENLINTICIDLHGNLWCGTVNKGISKFDGTNWTNYDTLNSGLIDNYISDIAVDNFGNMWIATFSGVSKFDGTNWTSYTTADGIYSNYVNKIFVDPSNTIWFGTDNSLSKYDGHNFSFSYLLTIRDINMDASGNLWMAYYSGAYKYNGTTFTTYNSSNTNNSINNSVKCILVDIQGNVWFGCANGLVRYDNFSWVKFIVSNSMANNTIHDIMDDHSGNTWFATFGGGVSKLTSSNIFINFNSSNGLIGNLVHSMAIDTAGNKWFGTSSGLSKFNDTLFTNFFPGNWIWDLKIDSLGRIWAATIDSGVFVFDNNGTILNTFNDTNSGLVDNWVRVITFDKLGNIWFGTNDSGVVKFHPPNNWTSYTTSDGLPSNNIRDFAIDSTNNLWIATYGGGISKFDGSSFTNYNSSNSQLPNNNNINTIAIDNLDNKWIGIDEEYGITKFSGNSWITYSLAEGLAGTHVNKIYIDTFQQVIWVGTENGVSKITCQPPQVNFESDTICFTVVGTNTHLINLATKIDSTSKYGWDTNNDGTVDFSGKDVSYNFPSHGIYPVKLTISNDNCTASITKNVIVGHIPNISLNLPDTVKFCSGNSIVINPVISNYDSSLKYNYNWSNGDTTSAINIVNQGKYIVTVSDYNCVSTPDSIHANVIEPFSGEQICLTTVDSLGEKNIITWEQTPNQGIAFYNIYKETAVNMYSPIANLPFNSLSYYFDLNSNPKMKSDKYKISVVDTCGNESSLSNFHQTMYLAVNHDSNHVNHLVWNKYEGITFNYFKICRGTDLSNIQVIDSVLSSVYSYSDSTGLVKKYYYFISVDVPSLCTPSPQNSVYLRFDKTTSNIADNGVSHNQGIDGFISESGQLFTYPNPFRYSTTIEFPNKNNSNYELSVTDLTGKVLMEIKNIKNCKVELNRNELSSGYYLIELKGEKLFRGRIIVQ